MERGGKGGAEGGGKVEASIEKRWWWATVHSSENSPHFACFHHYLRQPSSSLLSAAGLVLARKLASPSVRFPIQKCKEQRSLMAPQGYAASKTRKLPLMAAVVVWKSPDSWLNPALVLLISQQVLAA